MEFKKQYGWITLVTFLSALLGGVATTFIFHFSGGAGTSSFALKDMACGGGLTEIPPELRGRYSDISRAEYLPNELIAPTSLKYDLPFFGFVFNPANGEPGNRKRVDIAGCPSIVSLSPANVEFISAEMNLIVKSYISAEINNELTIGEAYQAVRKSRIVEKGIDFCEDVECGKNLSPSERHFSNRPYKYDLKPIRNENDLRLIRNTSDNLLTTDAFDRLLEAWQKENTSGQNDEEVLWGILLEARTIAVRHAKKTGPVMPLPEDS